MRIGATSYTYPADILTNVKKLAGLVQDVELVLFEIEDPERDIPSQALVRELSRIASDHDMTYTVHLPLELGLASSSPDWEIARRVIASTLPLSPAGFVVHLGGRSEEGLDDTARWVENAVASLNMIAEEACRLEELCVENLENQHWTLMDSILAQVGVSCCVDIGHLWKKDLDATSLLASWLPRARVVHLHGLEEKRDHQRLSLISASQLRPVVNLLRLGFEGVVTLEVFSEPDLMDSLRTLREMLHE